MKMIDNTPINDFNEDWGDPDGTGMKAKSLKQVQDFIKKKINKIEEESVRLKNDNESFRNSVSNQMSEREKEINEFKESVIEQVDNYKPVEIHGNVNNAADEEDLTAEKGLIKIANRNNLYGMGYTILRRNPTRNNGNTILTQEHFSKENTIYEIRYDFDLNGQTIQIPAGCTLMFNGGSVDNGCLLGNNTAITAGAYKIFGDNLMLHQYCFATKSGSYGENIYKLLWSDIANKKVMPDRTFTTRNWILHNDSGVRASNFSGNCVFSKPEKIELNVDSDFLLNANPGSFSEITSSTINVVENNLNTLAVLYLSHYKNGNILKIPRTSKWVFFYTNNIDDNLNETYIQPDTEIDLSTTTIYCTSLNRALINPEASTWCCDAKLEWFVGNNYYKSYVDFYKSPIITDQSGNIQRALDSSLNVISNIKGIIPIENTLYAEVRKKIDFGATYNLTDNDPFASNAQYKVKFSLSTTVILELSDKDVFVQRTTITFSGGLLTTYFAQEHNRNIWVVDMDYLTSYSMISTSLLGKADNSEIYTNAAFYANGDGNVGTGYTSFSTHNIYAKQTKYGIYASQNAKAYINSCNINAYVFDYYEGAHIRSAFGASIINITLQTGGHTPLGEFGTYRHAYINTARSTINVITWDFGDSVPESRKIFVSRNNYIMGNSAIGTNLGSVFLNYKDAGKSINREIIATNSLNTGLRLPLMQNVFAGINSDMMNNDYYCYKASTKGNIDIETYNDKIISLTDDEISINSNNISIYEMQALFGVGSALLPSMTLKANEFVEIYLSLKERFTLDKGVRFNLCAFDFGGFTNIFNKAKVIFIDKNDVKNVIDVDLTEGESFSLFRASKNLENIKSCICRLYGKQENNWGLGYDITKPTFFLPQIRGYSLHESCNYFDRRFQKITCAQSSNRPADALIGESIYDSTLEKPIWWNGSSWVDAMGEVV